MILDQKEVKEVKKISSYTHSLTQLVVQRMTQRFDNDGKLKKEQENLKPDIGKAPHQLAFILSDYLQGEEPNPKLIAAELLVAKMQEKSHSLMWRIFYNKRARAAGRWAERAKKNLLKDVPLQTTLSSEEYAILSKRRLLIPIIFLLFSAIPLFFPAWAPTIWGAEVSFNEGPWDTWDTILLLVIIIGGAMMLGSLVNLVWCTEISITDSIATIHGFNELVREGGKLGASHLTCS